MSNFETIINKEGYAYVEKLIVRIPEQTETQTLRESDKRRGQPLDWSDKIFGNAISKSIDGNEFETEMWLCNKEGEIGFNKSLFSEFKTFCFSIWESPEYNITSYKFIELTVFNWITNIKKNLVSTCELSNYLKDEIAKSIVEKTYYFEVINLSIDKGFNIGDVLISLYDEQKYKEHVKKSKEKGSNEEQIEAIYGKLRKGVFASVTVVAEPERGLEIAQEKAELAINVIKLFDSTVKFPYRKSKFGLDFKIHYQPQLVHYAEVNNELSITMSNQNDTFEISDSDFEAKFMAIFKLLSDFIKHHKQTELNRIILQSINMFGNAISTFDIHWRGVLMIQILESIMLKDDQMNDLEGKAKTRISKLISQDHNLKTQIKDDLSHVYQIRHKLMHKAKKIQIDLVKFTNTQTNIGSMIMMLLDLNKQFETKEELIEYLREIKS